MNFEFSEEQTMIRESVSRFLREKYDFETRQSIINSDEGWSREIWAQFAEMGLMGAAFPEEYDGFGGSAADMLVLMEEFGAALVVEPFLPTVVLCGQILRQIGGDHAKAIIPEIISGEMIIGFGYAEPRSRYCLHHVEATAKKDGDEYLLSGRKAVVLAAPIANKIIISARTSGKPRDQDGISLFLIDRDTAGLSIEGYPTINGHLAGEVHLDNVRVKSSSLLGDEGKAFPVIEHTIDNAIIATSAEAIGLCKKMSALTNEYARQREQFGVPISKFQVLQHNMVDMFIHTEEMVSMAYMAVMKSDTPGSNTKKAASAAKVQLGKSCKFVGETAVQIHGGMGITEEMAIGHYFMHSTMLDSLFGNSDYHLKRYQDMTT